MGWHYLNGEGCEKDVSKGSELIHESIKYGQSSYGQNTLGYMNENGIGVEKNYSDAFFWYKKSAEQGNPYAQWNLGRLYEEGKGTEQDREKAIYWYEKAASQGDEEVKSKLESLQNNTGFDIASFDLGIRI